MAEHAMQDAPPPPSLLLYHLKARRCTVGELIDFAAGVPQGFVTDLAHTLTDSIMAGTEPPPARRRKLVLLGALINRLIFEVEGIPKSRSARL